MGRDTIISAPNYSKKSVFENKQEKLIKETDSDVIDEISAEEIININKDELKVILWKITNNCTDIIYSMKSFVKFFTDFTERDEKILKVLNAFNEREEKLLKVLTSIDENIAKSVETKTQAIKILQGTHTSVDDCSKNKTLIEMNDKLQEIINLWK